MLNPSILIHLTLEQTSEDGMNQAAHVKVKFDCSLEEAVQLFALMFSTKPDMLKLILAALERMDDISNIHEITLPDNL